MVTKQVGAVNVVNSSVLGAGATNQRTQLQRETMASVRVCGHLTTRERCVLTSRVLGRAGGNRITGLAR